MRIKRSLIMGVIVVRARRRHRECAEAGRRSQCGGGLARIQSRSCRHPLLAADTDQHDERLDVAQAWSYRLRPSRADRFPRSTSRQARSKSSRRSRRSRERRDVSAVWSSGRCARTRDRERNLALRAARRTRLVPRVTYWPGAGPSTARIFFTSLRKLIALRADTGALDPTFGDGGELDLEILYSGVPVIYRNVILMGSISSAPASVTSDRT